MESSLIGEVVAGKYRVTAEIARGGMGRVYRAEQLRLARNVAIKVLVPSTDPEDQQEFEKRFMLEAATCAKLSHPNTIRIFDFGRIPSGSFFIAMELLEGRTLRQAMRSEGPFSIDRALHITLAIAESLAEAHGLNIVHRDIKPENIFLLSQSGGQESVKVLDFGLVKMIDDGGDSLTKSNVFLGSPHYVAPEQVNDGELDCRADIYSLGIILFEMISGVSPFARDAAMKSLMAQVNDPLPRLAKVAPARPVSPMLENAIRKACEKRPRDRFVNVTEFMRMLIPLVEERTLLTPVLDAVPPVRLRKSGPSFWVIFVVAALLGLALGGGYLAWQVSSLHQEEPQVQKAHQERPIARRKPVSRTFVVAVDSVPASARVRVGGDTYGTTPLEVTIEAEVRDGEVPEIDISLEKRGYQSVEMKHELSDERSVIHVNMVKR